MNQSKLDTRPVLDKNLSANLFKAYYWLKEELAAFCRTNGISASGNKQALTQRVVTYLDTGEFELERRNQVIKPSDSKGEISLQERIPIGYKNDERHRKFFKAVIGSHFKFNVPFMNWMQSNVGQTYEEAVRIWRQIETEKKLGKKYEIGSQFEYNQYTRDFFEYNPQSKREDMVKCWNYKKSLAGFHKYENSDLEILKTKKGRENEV